MSAISLNEYIEKAPQAIRDSVRALANIEVDDFNSGGCNGYIFFGNHKVYDTRVAVKYYCYGENAHQEVKLIKQIEHDNILRVWDACAIADDWAYFITDEHKNGNIDSLLESKNIKTSVAFNIIKGVISGVIELHSFPNRLLHRDLKPANILLKDNNIPIIADFGSIKLMPVGATDVIASQHSALYRPPESYDSGKYYFASDIYQIGLLFYQLLGGCLPYEAQCYMTEIQKKKYDECGDDLAKSRFVDDLLLKKSKEEKLLSYDSLPPYTDKQLVKIIQKATKADHKKRYTNIAALQNDIHKLKTLPDWYRQETMLICENRKIKFRIIMNQKNKYVIEREYSNQNWSQLRKSTLFDKECCAVDYLIKTF